MEAKGRTQALYRLLLAKRSSVLVKQLSVCHTLVTMPFIKKQQGFKTQAIKLQAANIWLLNLTISYWYELFCLPRFHMINPAMDDMCHILQL